MLVLAPTTAGTGVVSSDLRACMERHNAATLPRGVVERQGGYWVAFLSRGEPTCPDQCMLYKASHCLTTITCTISSPSSNTREGSLTPRLQPRTFAEPLFSLAARTRRVPVHRVAVVITKYFINAVTGKWRRTTVSFHVQSLRSFFRYASSQGWCTAGIAESIDAPRLYTFENLPQGPSWEEVGKLLASVNGTSPVQIRSRFAILLCAVYGLCVGEICGLRLEDIDWAAEKISVRRSKQRKVQTYPLTTEVGNALLRYLKEVRPRCTQREVLLTFRRPYRPVSVALFPR
jgi:integrase